MELNKMPLEIQKFSGGGEVATGPGFADMSHGVSQDGIWAVYDQIHTVIAREDGGCQQALADRANFESALDLGWIGADREVFKANMVTLANQISERLIAYDAAIRAQFDSIIADWDNFQNSNVTAQ